MKSLSTASLIIASLAAGYGFYYYQQNNEEKVATVTQMTATPPKPLSVLGQQRSAFVLPDLQDQKQSVDQWDNKVILLNFWATWCPPCRKEIPAFIQLQDDYGERGFQVIGVAIDEKTAVEDYADGLGVNYPILIGNSEALKVSSDYGNRFGRLPYSLVIDRQGVIRYIGQGELSYEDIEKQIKPLL
jgi:thiol-disulfide isomerase/thioredoxin